LGLRMCPIRSPASEICLRNKPTGWLVENNETIFCRSIH
jgi:hypothetical protein